MEKDLTGKILRSVPLLSHLNELQRSEVVSKFMEIEYKPADVIVQQGDVGDCFYIVKEVSTRDFWPVLVSFVCVQGCRCCGDAHRERQCVGSILTACIVCVSAGCG